MKKKTFAIVAAPLAVMALTLSACGSNPTTPAGSSTGTAPIAPVPSATSSAPTSAAPSSAPTSAAPSTDTSASPSDFIGEGSLGDADVDRAAKALSSKWSGSTVVGSKSGAFKMITGASTMLEKATIDPAVCKTLAVEAIKMIPADAKMAVVMDQSAATKKGVVTGVSFMSLGNDNYFKTAEAASKEQASKCQDMTMEMLGQKVTSKTTVFDVSGVQADVVSGVVTSQTVGGASTQSVSITASRGGVGVSAQGVGDSPELRAKLVDAVNQGFDALAASK